LISIVGIGHTDFERVALVARELDRLEWLADKTVDQVNRGGPVGRLVEDDPLVIADLDATGQGLQVGQQLQNPRPDRLINDAIEILADLVGFFGLTASARPLSAVIYSRLFLFSR
jgi:hypothetical protein